MQFKRTRICLVCNTKTRFTQSSRFSSSNSQTNVLQHRVLLEGIGKELGIKQLDDWYKISAKEVRRKGNFIYRHYRGSLSTALKKLYPEHPWDDFRFSKLPKGFWTSETNQRKFLDNLGRDLGVKTLDDWYNIPQATIRKKASFISDYYNNSVYTALQKLYPEHKWDPQRFSTVPRGYWNDQNNQRKYLETIGKELGVKELNDWYNVSADEVQRRATFIVPYYGTLAEALRKLYPHHEWSDWPTVPQVPRGHWASLDNQREYLSSLGKTLGVKKLDDWHQVSADEVRRKATFISHYYNNSLYETLRTLYPNHPWDPLRFAIVPRGFWSKESTKKMFRDMFLKWQQEHDIQQLKDWYQLPPKKVKLFQRVSKGIFGTVTRMLEEWFPGTNWSREIQASTPELDLQWMMRMTVDIKVHHKIGEYSVDIYVPEWNLALEYQGGQHYWQTWHGDVISQQKRDKNKREFLEQEKVTLVTVPHRWNGTWSQLRATIRQAQPALLQMDFQKTSVPNPFPERITMTEVMEAISTEKFFKRLEWDKFVSFDYDNSNFPMYEFRRVFQDPMSAPDEATKRRLQIFRECRGLKFSKEGQLLSRPFHKFFNLNELPASQRDIDLTNVECVIEKYDGVMIAPIKVDGTILFVSRGGSTYTALDKYIVKTRHESFADYIISKDKTPIFEFVAKRQPLVVGYKEDALILLAIRDNLTGRYSSYEEVKEEAAAFDILVAKQWPNPKNLDVLKTFQNEFSGIEGFVIKMVDGQMIKLKTEWWRQKRIQMRTKQ